MRVIYLIFMLLFSMANAQEINISTLKDKGNLLICDSIKINGRLVTGKLMFDTGSTTTLLDVAVLNSEDNNNDKEKISTYYGKLAAKKIKINTFEAGTLKEEKIEIRFIDIKKMMGDCDPENIIGIVGMDIIKKYNWKIDLKNNKLFFSELLYNDKDYSKYPVVFKYKGKKLYGSAKNRHPFFSMKVDDADTDFIIDTGAFEEIVMNSKEQKTTKAKLFEMQNSSGNVVEDEFFTMNKVNITNQEITLPVKYSDSRLTSVGIGFLKHFDMIFDKGFKNMYLKKREDFKPDIETKINFGFSIEKFYNNIRVSNVYKNSPADKSGLKVLDEIVSINGINLEQYNPCTNNKNIEAQFEQSQMTIQLKNGKTIIIKR